MSSANTTSVPGMASIPLMAARHVMDGRRWIICFLAAEEIKQAAREIGIKEENLTEQVMEDIAYRFNCGVDSALWNHRLILKDSIREAIK